MDIGFYVIRSLIKPLNQRPLRVFRLVVSLNSLESSPSRICSSGAFRNDILSLNSFSFNGDIEVSAESNSFFTSQRGGNLNIVENVNDITVKAEAVQTENVVPKGTAAADAAWAAFKTVEGNN